MRGSLWAHYSLSSYSLLFLTVQTAKLGSSREPNLMSLPPFEDVFDGAGDGELRGNTMPGQSKEVKRGVGGEREEIE